MATECAEIFYNSWKFDGAAGFPAPNVTLDTSYERFNNDGPITLINNSFTLDGKIFTTGFDKLVEKAKQLKNIFSRDGDLTITNFTGVPVRVTNFQLKPTQNYWTQTIDYTISLLNSSTGCAPSGDNVESCSNVWQIQPIEEYNYFSFNNMSGNQFPPFRVTHTVSAVGKYVPTGSGQQCLAISGYSAEKFKRALAYVTANFDSNKLVADGQYFDFTRSIDANTAEGSYSVTDSYLYFPSGGNSRASVNNYIDSCTIESSTDDSSIRTVTVQGTIKGLAILSGSPSFSKPYALSGTGTTLGTFIETGNNKFANALAGFNVIKDFMYARATGNAGYIPTGFCAFFYGPQTQTQQQNNKQTPTSYLNPRPLSSSVGYNPIAGEVTYSFTYNNRPANLIDCSLQESLTINDTFPAQQIAEVFVLGRRLGPVLQNLGTYSSPTRQVTFEATLPRASSISGIVFPTNIYKQITGVIELFNPRYASQFSRPGIDTIKSFVREDNESWDPTNGRFSKTKTWIYTKCQGTLEDLTNPNVG